jgi:endonuclease G
MLSTFKSIVLVLSLLGVSSAFAGFENCPEFFANGAEPRLLQPTLVPAQQRELCFSGFAILHSGQSKTPIFAVEKLNKAHLLRARNVQRKDRFYEEARLPFAERGKLADYRESDAHNRRYDRGHLIAAANTATKEAMAQSFSLANIVPQAPLQNRKAWTGIEKSTRKFVMRAAGDVYVFTGSSFLTNSASAPDTVGAVWVPRNLYKLVYDVSTNRAWAFWLENVDAAKVSKPISYLELVKRTGIEFLPGAIPRD